MRNGRPDAAMQKSHRMLRRFCTYPLAVVAHENGVPFYSVVPTPTVDLSLAHGDLIPIERRDANEVLGLQFEGQYVAPAGARANGRARNPAFDVTPHRYLTAIITENGIVRPPFGVNLARAVAGPTGPRIGTGVSASA